MSAISMIKKLNEKASVIIKGYEATSVKKMEMYHAAERSYKELFDELRQAHRLKTDSIELEKEVKEAEEAFRDVGKEIEVIEGYLKEDLFEIADGMSGAVHDGFKKELVQQSKQIHQEVIDARRRYLHAISKACTEHEELHQIEVQQVQLFQKLGFNTGMVTMKYIPDVYAGTLKVTQDDILSASRTTYKVESVKENNEDHKQEGSNLLWEKLKKQLNKFKDLFRKQKK